MLALARRHIGDGARLQMLALYPGYLDLTAAKAGSELNLYINAEGSYMVTNMGADPGVTPLFSLRRVMSDAPAGLARRIATFGHVPESQLNYMVAQVGPVDHHFGWLVYPRHGSRVEYFESSDPSGALLKYQSNGSAGLQPIGR